MPRNWTLILAIACLAACDSKIVDETAKAEYTHIAQSMPFKSGELLVARESSGGATNGFVYDVLACSSNAQAKCDILAHVDTNNGALPQILKISGRPVILVNRSDLVWGYSSFTYKIGAQDGTNITIQYR
jgi:hypothetical protein